MSLCHAEALKEIGDMESLSNLGTKLLDQAPLDKFLSGGRDPTVVGTVWIAEEL